MTVSYALRGSSEVSTAQRRRITRLAEAMGYRPDPLLSHLMQHLRANRTTRSPGNLAILADMRGGFVERQIAGVQARATQLGYHLDRLDPLTLEQTPGALTRVLVARGVTGVLLAGRSVPVDCSNLLDWSRFASVALTYSIIEPRMHRVVTHHFHNAFHTFAILADRGYRRIGLAMTPDMEVRTNHSYAAAFRHSAQIRNLPALPTLLLGLDRARELRAWFRRWKPDAVVVANANWFRNYVVPHAGGIDLRRIAFATLDTEPDHPLAGIDQVYERIGEKAVDTVVAQIHRNELGLPAVPVAALVEGQWDERDGLYPLNRRHCTLTAIAH
jgi:DNA-binding LacI/PurR family transcriptional regulator